MSKAERVSFPNIDSYRLLNRISRPEGDPIINAVAFLAQFQPNDYRLAGVVRDAYRIANHINSKSERVRTVRDTALKVLGDIMDSRATRDDIPGFPELVKGYGSSVRELGYSNRFNQLNSVAGDFKGRIENQEQEWEQIPPLPGKTLILESGPEVAEAYYSLRSSLTWEQTIQDEVDQYVSSHREAWDFTSRYDTIPLDPRIHESHIGQARLAYREKILETKQEEREPHLNRIDRLSRYFSEITPNILARTLLDLVFDPVQLDIIKKHKATLAEEKAFIDSLARFEGYQDPKFRFWLDVRPEEYINNFVQQGAYHFPTPSALRMDLESMVLSPNLSRFMSHEYREFIRKTALVLMLGLRLLD